MMTKPSPSLNLSENQLWFAEQTHSGFLVALWLDPADAAKLVIPGGEAPEALHVTLAYCGASDDIDELTQARIIGALYDTVRYTSELTGPIAGYGRFVGSETSDGKDVFYATPDISRLFDVRQQVIECLRCNGLMPSTAHGYTPHITLAYIDSDAENPEFEVPEMDLTFSGVTVMSGTRRIDIPFWKESTEATISMSETGELPLSAPLGSQPARALFFGSFDKEWIPFLPKPGVYNHEVFGSMDLTSETYDQMLRNFDEYVYKQDLPIRATHMPDTSGAIGWIKPGGMRLAEDGSLEVKPEWNELGRGLVDGDRFRYASAEFCRTWKNPVTEEVVNNVAVGLALVTRPHFKTDVMNPLSASEALAFGEFSETETKESSDAPVESEKGTELDPLVTPTTATNPSDVAVATSTPVVAAPAVVATPTADVTLSDLTQVVITAEQRQRERVMFSDLTSRVELAERRATTAESELKRVENDRRVEKFTAEVIGRSAENGQPWFGDPKANVAHLVSLSEQFGDNSPEVMYAVNQKRNEAKAIKATGIFDPIALSEPANASNVEAQIVRLAEQHRLADPNLSMEKAEMMVYNEHPDLYIASLKRK